MFRRAPDHRREFYLGAREAYEEIGAFFQKHRAHILGEYRSDPSRMSTFVLEVRKDCVMHFKDWNCRTPIEPRYDQINKIADILANALVRYLEDVD